MVHRIQNRNPGYSDFNVAGSAQSFNFSPTMSDPISHGANALKLENEINTIPTKDKLVSEMLSEQNSTNQEVEKVINNNQSSDYKQSFSEDTLSANNETEENNSEEVEHVSNGLENFGVEDENAPDLFNSESETEETVGLLPTEINEDTSEDNDLEIPAFLRRQKH